MLSRVPRLQLKEGESPPLLAVGLCRYLVRRHPFHHVWSPCSRPPRRWLVVLLIPSYSTFGVFRCKGWNKRERLFPWMRTNHPGRACVHWPDAFRYGNVWSVGRSHGRSSLILFINLPTHIDVPVLLVEAHLPLTMKTLKHLQPIHHPKMIQWYPQGIPALLTFGRDQVLPHEHHVQRATRLSLQRCYPFHVGCLSVLVEQHPVHVDDLFQIDALQELDHVDSLQEADALQELVYWWPWWSSWTFATSLIILITMTLSTTPPWIGLLPTSKSSDSSLEAMTIPPHGFGRCAPDPRFESLGHELFPQTRKRALWAITTRIFFWTFVAVLARLVDSADAPLHPNALFVLICGRFASRGLQTLVIWSFDDFFRLRLWLLSKFITPR